MESPEYIIDDNDRLILEIISNREGCTENYVRKKMSDNHKCSSVTAHNKVKNLIKIVEVEDWKIGNSFHKLRINDKTQFHRINKELDSMDTFLKIMIEPLLKIERLQQQGNLGNLIAASYMQHMVIPYFDTVFTMLWKLLELSAVETQIAKPDSFKLHMKIIELISKTTKQPFHELDHKKILATNKDILNRYRQQLLDPGTDNNIVNVAMVDDLLRRIEKFEVQFLN